MNVDPPINFPELPRSELERAIQELVDKASSVLSTQGRLRSLLAAARAINQNLDLPVVLRSIAQAAVDLVGARYGALAVIGPDGDLEQYVQVGLTDETMASLPYSHRSPLGGTGSPGPKPIPLETITRDPGSVGFPEFQPPIKCFLGVPIRVRGEIFGNLYLIDRAGGSFTAEDEELLTALAGTAGSAIDQARLLEETQWGRRWAIASAEVSSGLLNADGADPLALIAESVASLTNASLVLLIRETSVSALVVEHAWGEDADLFVGRVLPKEGSMIGSVIASGNPIVSPGVREPEGGDWEAFAGPAMVLPLSGASGAYGALAVVRAPGSQHFHDIETNLAGDFARHASVALELREARHARERIALLEERSRIARDLHDNVIQRLFGAGLTLHSIDIDSLPPMVRTKLGQVGEMMDQAISEIRKSVFALSTTERTNSTARHRLLDVVGEAASSFPTPPRIVFEGQLDEWAPDAMVDDLEAVIREGLANAARHAHASGVAVSVAADEREISVCITDDGRGPGATDRASGTANLEARALGWGGRSVLRPGEEGGAVLEWRVPTPARGAA
ncbi:GAF domain-containing sensor histidine kinase [Naasia sp. SYSU D00948]|uniref:GAF domain-containing sensor histidine kinase n=1 Tax=Naasia sp. SYSU D00948 TaxID=2817379 RepID=UPI001B3025B8|nr:GAF domain-containing protein [Naasia sp. SYSU D00948]